MKNHRPSCRYNPCNRADKLRAMAGFTLIEALIVILIASILATMAVPSYTSFVAGQRVNSVAADLVVTMMKARSDAVMRNASVTVAANAGGWQNGWQTTVVDNTGTTITLDSHGAAPQSVAISASIANGSTVIFQSSGRLHPTQTGLVGFTVTSSTSTSAYQCVTTELSGRPISKTTTPCP